MDVKTSHNLPEDDQYPRVLVVMMTKVKADDKDNLLVRTQFGDWPKERLAQIHSGEATGYGEFCGQYYQLQKHDRRFGGIFRRLRSGVAGLTAMETIKEGTESIGAGFMRRWIKAFGKRFGDLLENSGLWEVIFGVRLSGAMAGFIRNFDADLIYCQGYSLGFSALPLLISRRFGIPICFQTTDDWPMYLYRGSPVAWILRRQARQLVANATVRMAFGDKMRAVYEQRYQRSFQVTYHADRFERFENVGSGAHHALRSIVFTGSLGFRRYEGISDLLQAVRSLAQGSPGLEIRVYCSGIPKEMPKALCAAPELRFFPLPSHHLLPSILRQADILFLPESFSVDPRTIELSVSSKCHLYMMSGRPILAYGPSYSGTVEYAMREGWAKVINRRIVEHLRLALLALMNESALRNQLAFRAKEVAQRNHDVATMRNTFQKTLVNVCTMREARTLPGAASPKPKVNVIRNRIPPYGT